MGVSLASARSGRTAEALCAMLEKAHSVSTSCLSSPECSYSVPAGVRGRIGYIPLVGGRVSAMPRASLSLVSTSHTLLGVASRKRAPGLSA
jgi:hypothetical protein